MSVIRAGRKKGRFQLMVISTKGLSVCLSVCLSGSELVFCGRRRPQLEKQWTHRGGIATVEYKN
jgi:hypothetical protein